jgi:hypothetical protein
MKKISFLSVIFILAVSSLNVFPAYPSDENICDKATDLSDRKYEQVLIDLLDNAKESIVVSMYDISPGAGEKTPVMLLLNDLKIFERNQLWNVSYICKRVGHRRLSIIGNWGSSQL